jgi:hypothetical protein
MIVSVSAALAVLAPLAMSVATSGQASAWPASLASGSAAQAQAQPAPSPPSTVTATCTSTTGNTLIISWPAVAHATTYSIYQARSLNGTYTLTSTVAASPVTTGSLVAGTYFYKVSTTIGANWVSAQSAASNSRTITPTTCS